MVQYDPDDLVLEEDDEDFKDTSGNPTMNLLAYDYYPALGKKEVWIKVKEYVCKKDETDVECKANKQKIWDEYNPNEPSKRLKIEVEGYEGRPDNCFVEGVDGSSFSMAGEKGRAKFKVYCPPNTKEGEMTVLFKGTKINASGGKELKGSVTFYIKSNKNVKFDKVLSGREVYIHDADTESKSTSTYIGFDFVQELFNQVIPRKRSVTGYVMIDEDGKYNDNVEIWLSDFKAGFNLDINTRVRYQRDANGKVTYLTEDNTSLIFRKLMKDYNHIDSSAVYLDRVVDKDTLAGENGYQQGDVEITTNGSVIKNTGLYELYNNVVRKFVDKMIEEGMTYANAGTSFKDRDGSVRQGVSYSFGSNKSLVEFTDKATATRHAPKPFTNDTYRGSIPEDAGKQYAGLEKGEQRQWTTWFKNTNNTCNALAPDYKFYPQYWNGIDCSAFVQRVINSADPQINSGNGLPSNLNILVDDLELYGINCNRRELKYRAWVAYFFDDGAYKGDVTYYGTIPDAESEKVKILRNLKKGDLIRYGDDHVSTVYSDKSSCNDKDGKTTCTYEIIHAYGGDCTDYNKKTGECKPGTFSRKVLKTPNEFKGFPMPTGFGRIKLWD